MIESQKLNFPVLSNVWLKSFSLFSLQPDISVEIQRGVTCIAGANGLGKSTFLAAINFGFTGIVTDPKRDFQSVQEYYNYSFDYSADFFSGRIQEIDRELSAVILEFHIGDDEYRLSRPVFRPDELDELKVIRNNEIIFDLENSERSTLEANKEYKKLVSESTDLDSFEQFVFMQHVVFTFDEGRRLLLWDKRALNQALHISFGSDPAKASKADNIYREMERAASLARNANWQASTVAKEIDLLREAFEDTNSDLDVEDFLSTHKQIEKKASLAGEKFESKRQAVEDARLEWMEASAKVATLEEMYEFQFNERLTGRHHLEMHPVILAFTENSMCGLCGSQEIDVEKEVLGKIRSGVCPLCGSGINDTGIDQEVLVELRNIDNELKSAKQSLAQGSHKLKRLEEEKKACDKEVQLALKRLSYFEKENEKLLTQFGTGVNNFNLAFNTKQEELQKHLDRKKEKYTERDRLREEYLILQRELQARYVEAEKDFVPLLRNLGELFLGLDLDVRIDLSQSATDPGLNLTIDLEGQIRRQAHQLSESQRFFLDIALRMALAQYCSEKNSTATLFIDTPEGSLDIAYEARAGMMFGDFVKNGHDILMTANINSSEILRKLARSCGRSWMTIHRMTRWAELSDVQAQGETLFSRALEEIEKALDMGMSG